MLVVLGPVLRVYYDVIEVYVNVLTFDAFEDVVHGALKHRRRVRQAEGHPDILVESRRSLKCCFGYVLLPDRDLVVPARRVQCREDEGAL